MINILRGSVSAGFNDVPELIVKCCLQFITIPLVLIFHLSFPTRYFPGILKIAKIQPMIKKGHEKFIKNIEPCEYYRFFSKILEKLMFNRLNSFVQKCNILTDAEHSFRGSRSMETASHSFI